MIHCSVTSRRVFCSTSAPLSIASPSRSSPSSELSITSSPLRDRTTTNVNLNHRTISQVTKHKRPLSSVAVYHHYEDEHYDNVNVNVELGNFLNNVNRNNEVMMDPPASQHQHQQSQYYTNVDPNTKSSTTGSCCYTTNNTPRFPCGSNHHEDELDDLPPPLAEPKYSVHKRVLPAELTAFSSQQGKRYLMEAFAGGTAESYWKLTEHFVNQSDPAFCGVTTLLMCLNAMCIDPNIRWRGGWRFYGSEDVLLNRCCFSAERIRRKGIILEDFARLGRCHGLKIDMKRPLLEGKQDPKHDDTNNNGSNGKEGDSSFSLDDFRNDIRWILSGIEAKHQPLLVTSFSRSALGQTGEGHFSPIAAYHEETDQVLVLDVARFKYAPYWVRVEDLFQSMRDLDSVTKKPRGWFLLSPPKNHECIDDDLGQENRRPIETVPKMGDPELCPISNIKVHFCKGNKSTVPSSPLSSSRMEKTRSSIPL
jgi:glutathione gamma-glutamylcysteinyltransferase